MRNDKSVGLVSRRARALRGQSMFQIMMRAREIEARGGHVIHFEIGDPDYSLTTELSETVACELRKDNGNYAASQGLEELLQASSDRFSYSRGFRPSLSQLLVTPGANIQVFLILTCVADPGDQVLIPNPGFVTYRDHCHAAGVEPVPYSLRPDNNFEPDLNELDDLIGPRVKALILNTPHNPTGAVYSEEIIREIFSMCEKHNVVIISDEVYSRQVSPGKTFFSPSTIDLCKERVFVVHSLSKTFGLTGWRIGVLTGPDSLMPSIQLAAEAMLSCVPPFIQVAAAVALQRMNDTANNWVNKIEIRKKRFYQDLDELEALDLQQSDGTFYCFGRLVAPSHSSTDVANQLLESSHVAVVPGDHFGTLGKGYLRFALTTSDQDCLEGAQRISRFFDSKLL